MPAGGGGVMRMSELGGKELIDLSTGERLGMIHEADLVVDPEDGTIAAILLPERRGFWRKARGEIAIPWAAIRTIGPEMVIVELGPARARAYG
ncbi:YlmC/YmxH family sporulation protein [Hydrogenibacillus sp. N12]|uniref:YlmC/YmxH family sporulation protein n=1 Tax=Hydrogenibacillus sp. N12 TaxID=2866627 RepID=UPI00207BFDA9|nr:YlmC/YmxH family sporulation protein [Hydrogenibacillus sp. N12]